MRNLRIRSKLFLGFGMVLFLLILLAVVSFSNMNSIYTQADSYAVKTVPNLNHIWQIRRDMVSVERYICQAISNSDEKKTAETLAKASEDEAAIFTEIVAYKANTRQDPALVDKLNDAIKDLSEIRMKIEKVQLSDSETRDAEALAIYLNEYEPLFATAAEEVMTLFQGTTDNASKQEATSKQVKQQSDIILISVSLLSLIIGVFMALYITGSITRPIKSAVLASEEMAKGNLASPPSYVSKDEAGLLCESMRTSISAIKQYITDISYAMEEMEKGNFAIEINNEFKGDFLSIKSSINSFVKIMSDTLLQIRLTADEVSSGAELVSGGAQALAQGTTEQASSVEELSSTIAEISSQVKQNADSAAKADEMAQSETSSISNSNSQMQKLMHSMDTIHNKSTEINKIIKTIEDIAFQTNILALNAAVEAARAGAAGKGFAVVAEEVRNLAGKSADAAKNTTALIEDSVSSINEGVELAQITAQDLISVVDTVETTTNVISDITKATSEQSTSLEQVTIGLSQISTVVQANSATSEESAAAAEELSSQANLLKELIARFNLGNDIRNAAKQRSFHLDAQMPAKHVPQLGAIKHFDNASMSKY